MEQITLHAAREKLPELSRSMAEHRGSECYAITDHGNTTMVVMSVEMFRQVEDTLECQSDGNLMDSIRRSREDVAAGRVLSEDEADAAIGW
jgi:PHD/YefM family antitoxin component YafN of YafNO toxin-antitoxin module